MQKLLAIGLLVIFAGFALVIAGSGQGSSSLGGAVFIGPFPIAFGSGPGGGDLALASVMIGGIMVALLLLWGWRLSKMAEAEAGGG